MQEIAFPGFKFQKFSGGVHPQTPPIHAWYIGHTRGFQPLLSPSNILYHRKVPFQKMPPHGKILKKGPGVHSTILVYFATLLYIKHSALNRRARFSCSKVGMTAVAFIQGS